MRRPATKTELQGRVVAITGGARGIALATAKPWRVAVLSWRSAISTRATRVLLPGRSALPRLVWPWM
jgi:NAD(P)-dependent dehydrogenase (short-subunit alcohol dehydrogenase family)